MKKYVVTAISILLLFGVVMLYKADSKSVERAKVVEKFFVTFCASNNRYPTIDELKQDFPEFYAEGTQWYYWPNDDYTGGTYQYPMTLPLPSAPGRSKISEFFPMIYSYAYNNPCGLIEK